MSEQEPAAQERSSVEVDPMSSPEEYLKSRGLGSVLSDEPRVSHRPPDLVPRVYHFTEQQIQEFRERIFRSEPLPNSPSQETEE